MDRTEFKVLLLERFREVETEVDLLRKIDVGYNHSAPIAAVALRHVNEISAQLGGARLADLEAQRALHVDMAAYAVIAGISFNLRGEGIVGGWEYILTNGLEIFLRECRHLRFNGNAIPIKSHADVAIGMGVLGFADEDTGEFELLLYGVVIGALYGAGLA
jgi:hypothetical protein